LEIDASNYPYSSMSHDRCRLSVTESDARLTLVWTIPFDKLDPDAVSIRYTNQVYFKTTNEQPAIGDLRQGKQATRRDAYFYFNDAAAATRFAQALRTAISLCGGQPSKKLDFAPK
jgi:hypothetical protein